MKEMIYSDFIIKSTASRISRAYPVSEISSDESANILSLLTEALKILGIKEFNNLGNVQALVPDQDISPAETIESLTDKISQIYSTENVLSSESAEILNRLWNAQNVLFYRIPVPFTFKGIEYRFADKDNEKEIDGIINLLADTFSKEDKQKCLGLTFDDVRLQMEPHIMEEVKDQNVMVAVDEDENLIGALSWMEFAKDISAHKDRVSPKYAPNYALWKKLEDNFRVFFKNIMGREIRDGDVIRFKNAAVNRNLMDKVLNRDIGNTFFLFSAFLALQRNYIAAYGTEASVISQYLSIKNGMIALDEIAYEDFMFSGQRPFKNIYAETPKKDSVYKNIMSVIAFIDPYNMELSIQSKK